VYNGGWGTIAYGGDVIGSKYSTSMNPETSKYYRLHILNVGMSDLKKYRCERRVDNMFQHFYLELDLLGRCIKSCKVIV
jgi:hypothetical protein